MHFFVGATEDMDSSPQTLIGLGANLGPYTPSGLQRKNHLNVVTKIFIVLVSLLAVLLVPLIAVNATSATALRMRIIDMEVAVSTAEANVQAQALARQNSETALNLRNSELQRDIAQLEAQRTGDLRSIAQLEGQLAGKEDRLTSLAASYEVFAQTDRSKADLTSALVGELRDIRVRALASERQANQLDQTLSEIKNQLDVADAARRKLQEEVVRLTDQKAQALGTVSRNEANVGDLPEARAGATGTSARVPADRNLSATVIAVRRSSDGSLAEINAGSRDGVGDGWVMAITDGSRFVGNLRIIETDVNRATGVIELEDKQARGEVKPGMSAIARKGE